MNLVALFAIAAKREISRSVRPGPRERNGISRLTGRTRWVRLPWLRHDVPRAEDHDPNIEPRAPPLPEPTVNGSNVRDLETGPPLTALTQ